MLFLSSTTGLGHRERGRAQSNYFSSCLPTVLCAGLEEPSGWFWVKQPRWSSNILSFWHKLQDFPATCFICWHLRVAVSGHLDAIKLRIAEDVFGSIQFFVCYFCRLSHVDLVREDPFSDGEVEESNIKRMHFSCWSIWPGDTWSCGLPHWAAGVCRDGDKNRDLSLLKRDQWGKVLRSLWVTASPSSNSVTY